MQRDSLSIMCRAREVVSVQWRIRPWAGGGGWGCFAYPVGFSSLYDFFFFLPKTKGVGGGGGGGLAPPLDPPLVWP